MKKNWRNRSNSVTAVFVGLVSFVVGSVMVLAVACTNHDEASHDTYTCPMHPAVISDRPGTCPVCGMNLVRKARVGEEIKITEDLARLMKSPNEIVVASVKTIRGEFKSVPLSVEATGIVTYDTRNVFTIAARVGGRIESVSIKYNYQQVRKGQKLADIYSPELATAQRELIFLLENDPENRTLIESANTRLELLGLTPAQISRLSTTRELQNTFAIYSPYNGYVIPTDPAPSVTGRGPVPETTRDGGMSGMNGGASAQTQSPASAPGSSSASLIREGSYVSAGETLFRVVNTDALRIELNLPASDAAAVKTDDNVLVIPADNDVRDASVDFVQPFYSDGQNFVKIRVYTRQTEGLHIGHLVRAQIKLQAKESLWVPRESVLDLGTQHVVFIKNNGAFRPTTVTTGLRAGDLIEIRRGLATSDEIAATAHYLVDSESFVKPVN